MIKTYQEMLEVEKELLCFFNDRDRNFRSLDEDEKGEVVVKLKNLFYYKYSQLIHNHLFLIPERFREELKDEALEAFNEINVYSSIYEDFAQDVSPTDKQTIFKELKLDYLYEKFLNELYLEYRMGRHTATTVISFMAMLGLEVLSINQHKLEYVRTEFKDDVYVIEQSAKNS